MKLNHCKSQQTPSWTGSNIQELQTNACSLLWRAAPTQNRTDGPKDVLKQAFVKLQIVGLKHNLSKCLQHQSLPPTSLCSTSNQLPILTVPGNLDQLFSTDLDDGCEPSQRNANCKLWDSNTASRSRCPIELQVLGSKFRQCYLLSHDHEIQKSPVQFGYYSSQCFSGGK